MSGGREFLPWAGRRQDEVVLQIEKKEMERRVGAEAGFIPPSTLWSLVLLPVAES